MKEQNGVAPIYPRDTAEMVSPQVQNPQINCYRGEGDPVEHIERHEAFFLGRTNNNNHFAMLFPSTLGGVTSD